MWNAPKTDISRALLSRAANRDRGPLRARARCASLRAAAWRLAAALAIWAMAVCLVAAGAVAAAAEEMQAPRLSHINPDWDAVAADINLIGASIAAPSQAESLAPMPDLAAHGRPSIDSLNRATAELFPKITESPVPVLLPFDTIAFLTDRAAGVTNKHVDDYLSGFHLSPFFLPGPSGYDAMFTAQASEMPELGINFSGTIDIFISGFSLLYELDEPVGMIERPAKGLEADFPGIRHVLLENYARDTFTRYGVPYVVSILCFDGGTRYRMISCRDAGKVAERFLKALHLAGGAPPQQAEAIEAATIGRPQTSSADFAFYPPGDIIQGTGFKGKSGRSDYTVYSKMRFPLDAPAYANSQSFMNWGDCDSTGRVHVGMSGSTSIYRCRIGGLTLLLNDESAGGNYSYPWRDNFCEHRYFLVGQCPGGLGHQGQDIRPGSCKQRIQGANRCEPYQHDVVAVRDGMVLRRSGQMPVYLFVNAPNEHIRFRYLHMSPQQLDQEEVLTGRMLKEGEAFGKVGNFFQRERATTYHLHFDMQVPTKYGWVFVNPYMTLVAAYERLIGGRGTEIKDEPPVGVAAAPIEGAPPVTDPPLPEARPGEIAIQSEGEDRIEGPSHVRSDHGQSDHGQPDQLAPDAAKGTASPRLDSSILTASTGPGPERERAVRPMGHGFPRKSDRPRHIRRNLFAGHAWPKTGYHRF
jgi:hypothetical protein